MTTEQAFLDAIRASPGDDTNRLVYADWLEEHGDLRGQYIRRELELARLDPDDPAYDALEAEMQSCRNAIDPHWVNEVSRAYDLVLVSYAVGRKIWAIKVIRELTSAGLAEAKAVSEALPATIWRGVSRVQAESSRARFAEPVPARTVIRLSDTAARPPSVKPVLPGEGCNIVLYGYPRERKIELIRLVRELTKLGLVDAKVLVERPLPVVLLTGQSLPQAQEILPRFLALCQASIQQADS